MSSYLIRIGAAYLADDGYLEIDAEDRGVDYILVHDYDEEFRSLRELTKAHLDGMRTAALPREILRIESERIPARRSKQYGMMRAMWLKAGADLLPDALDEVLAGKRAEHHTPKLAEADVKVALPPGGLRVGYQTFESYDALGEADIRKPKGITQVRAGVVKVDTPSDDLAALVAHYRQELRALGMKPAVAKSSSWIDIDFLQVRGKAGALEVSITGRRRKQIGGFEIGVLWVEHGVVAARDVR